MLLLLILLLIFVNIIIYYCELLYIHIINMWAAPTSIIVQIYL